MRFFIHKQKISFNGVLTEHLSDRLFLEINMRALLTNGCTESVKCVPIVDGSKFTRHSTDFSSSSLTFSQVPRGLAAHEFRKKDGEVCEAWARSGKGSRISRRKTFILLPG